MLPRLLLASLLLAPLPAAAQVAASALAPALSAEAALGRFYTTPRAPLWMEGAGLSPAGRLVLERLRTASHEGYAGAPELVARIDAALATPGTAPLARGCAGASRATSTRASPTQARTSRSRACARSRPRPARRHGTPPTWRASRWRNGGRPRGSPSGRSCDPHGRASSPGMARIRRPRGTLCRRARRSRRAPGGCEVLSQRRTWPRPGSVRRNGPGPSLPTIPARPGGGDRTR